MILVVAAAACGERVAPGDVDGSGRCSTMIESGDACNQYGTACTWSEGIDSGGNSPLHRCDCLGDTWRCVTIDNPCPGGNLPSSEDTCTDGDTCDYVDWEHECYCNCAGNHRWDCSPGTIGSSQVCPAPTLDAGVNAP